MKKLVNVAVCSMCMLILSSAFIPTLVSAKEYDVNQSVQYDSQNKIFITKNAKYIEFEQEAQELGSKLTPEKFFELVKKYDGARITLSENSPYERIAYYSGWTQDFVNGGVNSFATSRDGLENARGTFAAEATIHLIGSAGNGFLYGGGIGFLLGLIGGSMLASKCGEARDIMARWIDAGSNSGGVRMTLTDTFPISSLYSSSYATVRKLS